MKQLDIFDVTKNDDNCKRVIISRDLLAPYELKDKLDSVSSDDDRRIWREHVHAVQDANNCNFVEARDLLITKRGVPADDLINDSAFAKIVLKAYISLCGIKEYPKELIDKSIDTARYEKIITTGIKKIDLNNELNKNVKLENLIKELEKIEIGNEEIKLKEVTSEDLFNLILEGKEREKVKKFKGRIISINENILSTKMIECDLTGKNSEEAYKDYQKILESK